ncbi:hypothetical protein [Bradyrhizobium sp. SZCCHNRI2049]|uniref:hypothetical protein n=1 Tax=Bradyrhizobium sp. SZCCHNRI2049 TaxID=3057287 RepID=UPI00291609B7|nr:hypothetical protein [Bradyrhizobium sp. SZCCHNRI2049]
MGCDDFEARQSRIVGARRGAVGADRQSKETAKRRTGGEQLDRWWIVRPGSRRKRHLDPAAFERDERIRRPCAGSDGAGCRPDFAETCRERRGVDDSGKRLDLDLVRIERRRRGLAPGQQHGRRCRRNRFQRGGLPGQRGDGQHDGIATATRGQHGSVPGKLGDARLAAAIVLARQ